MLPLVSCVVITYNSTKFFETFFGSLSAQKNSNIELIFIDNASADGSFEEAQKMLLGSQKAGGDRSPFSGEEMTFSEIKWIKNEKNLGYSGAAEQGVKIANGKYILIANPDIVFDPDYVSVLVERMERDLQIGAITGKLLKFDFPKYFSARNEVDDYKGGKTKIIDSAGLVMYKSRRCVDRGQGILDEGQFDKAEEVFGITGAAPLYRASALRDIEIDGVTFEPDFFMYKEDIDVSWRLRLMGWSCFYEPVAIAYHGRGTGAVERENLASVRKNRASLPQFTKHHSYRNERVMRLRNEFASHVFRDFLPILWREILMFGWMIVREPFLFKSLVQFIARVPDTLKKRATMRKKIKIPADQMRRWFV